MRLVVDANVFIAAFLKNALTRELLLDERLDLTTPEFGLIETRKKLEEPKLLKRLGLSREELAGIWSILTEPVEAVPRSEYQSAMREAALLISDPDDVPYLACALKFKWAVWSNDPHFQDPPVKSRVTILTTSELIDQLKRRQR